MLQEDMTLLKNFDVTERVCPEVRASASNALNRVTFGSTTIPNTTQNSPQFGLFTGQGDSSRNVQFGARVSF
jgi:hypothetical protein